MIDRNHPLTETADDDDAIVAALTAQLDAERFAHANTAVKVKRIEELADRLDREASEYLGRPVHSQAGDRIRAALNGDDQ